MRECFGGGKNEKNERRLDKWRVWTSEIWILSPRRREVETIALVWRKEVRFSVPPGEKTAFPGKDCPVGLKADMAKNVRTKSADLPDNRLELNRPRGFRRPEPLGG
jgi:hypothetical protein